MKPILLAAIVSAGAMSIPTGMWAETASLAKPERTKIMPDASQVVASRAGELVDVTVTFNMGSYDSSPEIFIEDDFGGVYDFDSENVTRKSNNKYVFKLPKGTYHGVMCFVTKTPECSNLSKYVFLNDSEAEDGATWHFDANTATHRISFEYCLGDGEKAHLVDMAENPTGVDFSSGNCRGTAYQLLRSVHNDNVGLQGVTYLECNLGEYLGTERMKCNDMFVNTTTEHYNVWNNIYLQPTDAEISFHSQKKPVCLTSRQVSFAEAIDTIYAQKASDFVACKMPSFKNSRYEGKALTRGNGLGDVFTPVGSLFCRDINSTKTCNYMTGMDIYTPDVMFLADLDPDAPVLIDYSSNEADIYDSTTSFDESGIVTPKFTVNRDGSINYLMTDNVPFRFPFADLLLIGWNVWDQLDAHPFFKYSSADQTPAFGDSAPILSFPAIQSDAPDNNQFSYIGWSSRPSYIGNFGELRLIDKQLMTFKVMADDELVMEDFNNFPWSLSSHAGTAHTPHEITLIFDNDNFEIDGLQGRSHTEVKYKEASKGDISAPSVQMIQFRNKDGKITNRFEKADEAEVFISYGDFYYEPTTQTYEINDNDVKIEVAPYGSDDFKEISTEQDADLYKWPLWGYFRSGQLSDIGESANGWWDLRITLTDKAGNSSFQHVSPAFYVKDSGVTGINQVAAETAFFIHGNKIISADDKTADFRIYSLSGSQVAATTAASVDLSDYPAGIYLVYATNTRGTRTLKISVK